MNSYEQFNVFLSFILIGAIIYFFVKKTKNDNVGTGSDFAAVVDSVFVNSNDGYVEYIQPPQTVIVDIYAVPLNTFTGDVEAWVSLTSDHSGNTQEIVAPTIVSTASPYDKILLHLTDYEDANYPNANLESAPAYSLHNQQRSVYFGIDMAETNEDKRMQFIVLLYEYNIVSRNIADPYLLSAAEKTTLAPRNPSGCVIRNGCFICGNGQVGCSNTNSCHCPASHPRWWNHRCKRLWPSNDAAPFCNTGSTFG